MNQLQTEKKTQIKPRVGVPTVCFDIDPGAVQQNYDLVKKNKEKFMMPLRMDLTNPSPDLSA